MTSLSHLEAPFLDLTSDALNIHTYIHTYIQEAFLTRHFQRSQRGDTKICINKKKKKKKNEQLFILK